MNNKLLIMALKLTIICAVAALILGLTNMITEPIIIERKVLEQIEALRILSDGDHVGEVQSLIYDDDLHGKLLTALVAHDIIRAGDDIDERELITAIYPVDRDGEIIRYILQLQANGYGGKMKLFAVFEIDGTFNKAKLMDNGETPGLGKKAEEPQYYTKYRNSGTIDNPLPVNKRQLEAKEAESISGSTITFDGIYRALALGSVYVRIWV